jgi:hypothetical protein
MQGWPQICNDFGFAIVLPPQQKWNNAHNLAYSNYVSHRNTNIVGGIE